MTDNTSRERAAVTIAQMVIAATVGFFMVGPFRYKEDLVVALGVGGVFLATAILAYLIEWRQR